MPPAHLPFFAPRTIERLLNDAGFEIVRILADGRVSTRPRLTGPHVQRVLGTLGVGNVMTILAVRSAQPRRRPLAARIPGLQRARLA